MKAKVFRFVSVFQLACFLFLGGTKVHAKTFLVTCATSGIGRQVVSDLSKGNGTQLLLGSRNLHLPHLEKLKSVGTLIQMDFADIDSIYGAQQLLKSKGLTLDGLVLIAPRPTFDAKSIPEPGLWQENLTKGFVFPVELIRKLVPFFAKGASIVVISGVTSKSFSPDYMNSNVIRTMWNAEIKNLSQQLADYRIRVNAVSPGFTLTEHNQNKVAQWAKEQGVGTQEYLELATSKIPARRYGDPSDISALIRFLLSEESTWINGQNIVVDGGESRNY